MIKDLILESIQAINVELGKIEHLYDVACKKQSVLEGLKNDIEHEIELNKLSGSEMMKKYKELQACLKIRRKYKDEVEYLLAIRSNINLTRTKLAKENIKAVDKKLQNRNYKHRIKQEIREEILAELDNVN